MKIAIMLRSYDRAGGVGVYARNIVENLLAIDRQNHYLLMYNRRQYMGEYQELDNVDEIYLPLIGRFVWDQFQVPISAAKHGVDLIFNTKFSVPFATSIKTVMVLHGASWFVHPELYQAIDIHYVRKMMPLYCHRSNFMISNSDLTTHDFINILKVPQHKIETVHLAAGNHFVPVEDNGKLNAIRGRYSLPSNYIVTVTSYDPRKNFSSLLKAYRQCAPHTDTDLVVVGKDCELYGEDFNLRSFGIQNRVHFTGWVDQKDLPAIYSMASAFVFPSVYEEFGIPVVEAMSCGCPVISSTTGAIPGLVGEAALLSDPNDYHTIAQHILDIVKTPDYYDKYRNLGLAKAQEFSWKQNAQRTLEIFEHVYNQKEII